MSDQPPDDAKAKDRARAAVSLATVAIAPVQAALTQLAAHDLSNRAETTPIATLMRKTVIATTGFSALRRNIRRGWKQGQAAAQAERQETARRTIEFPKTDLPDQASRTRFVRDLATLAADDRTALDLNARMSPSRVATAAQDAMAKPGDKVTLDLNTVGIRASPNLVRALNDYGRGGREELVAAGLLQREAGLGVGPAPSQPGNARASSRDTGMEV